MIPVFDLGNVIVEVRFESFLDWLSGHNKAGHDLTDVIENPVHLEFEKGLIAPDAFATSVREHLQADFATEEFFQAFNDIFPTGIAGMDVVLETLAARDAVFCLSNTNEEHLRFIEKKFPEMRSFTRTFASHDLKVRKPEPEIYELVRAELDVPAADLVFFDDRAENITAAKQAGWQAHLFENADQVRSVLKV